MPEPRLIETVVPAEPEGVALVLHGGGSRPGDPPVAATQPSVVRMLPTARRLARVAPGRLAVFRLLNAIRGWGTGRTPVDDARWALDRIAERLGDARPACLVGHSLGGRAALFAGSRPEVRAVVALNPWVQASDAPTGLEGRDVLVVHGDADAVAPLARAEAVLDALPAAVRTAHVTVGGGTHAMLRRHRVFDGLAAEHAASTLLAIPPRGVLARVADGERRQRV